jgi:hypothetical protein
VVLDERENKTEMGRWPTQQKKELNLSVLFYICIIVTSANWTSHP